MEKSLKSIGRYKTIRERNLARPSYNRQNLFALTVNASNFSEATINGVTPYIALSASLLYGTKGNSINCVLKLETRGDELANTTVLCGCVHATE